MLALVVTTAATLAATAFMPFIIVGVIALFIFGAIAAHKAEKARRKALDDFARQYALTFEPGQISSIDRRFPYFECFQTGSDRYGENVLRGSRSERGIFCFDYHYETYSTDSKGRRTTHHHYSSNVVIDVGFPLSPLNIRTENFFDKLSQAVGFDDIDFESAEFSKSFVVKAPDRKWAFTVINTRVMEILLEGPRFVIEMGGTCLLLRRTRREPPAVFGQAITLGMAVLDALPADVVRDRRGQMLR